MDTRTRLLALGEFSTGLVAATINFGGTTALLLIVRSVRRPKPARRASDLFEDAM